MGLFFKAIRRALASSERWNQQGQTAILNVMIAVAVMGILMIPISQAFSQAQAWYSRFETQSRLTDIVGAITNAYIANTKQVEAQTGAVFALPLGTISPVIPQTLSGGTRLCLSTPSTFSPLATYTNLSSSLIYKDGFGKPMCIFISTQKSTTTQGQTVFYHNLAVVSAGRDGSISSATTLTASGALVTGGDDIGRLIDGSAINTANLNLTISRMSALITALQSYFYGRYQSNINRDTALDYFSNAFDTSGILPDTGGVAIAATAANFPAALGISGQGLQDAYGSTFTFDNSSSAVRSPSNPNGIAYTSQPFTANVCTTLPGGQALCQTALGSY